jgi:hypothetical protein
MNDTGNVWERSAKMRRGGRYDFWVPKVLTELSTNNRRINILVTDFAGDYTVSERPCALGSGVPSHGLRRRSCATPGSGTRTLSTASPPTLASLSSRTATRCPSTTRNVL